MLLHRLVEREMRKSGSQQTQVFHRALLAGAVLLSEYIFFSVRFDVGSKIRPGDFLAIIGTFGTVAPLAAIVLTMLALLSGRQLRQELARLENTTNWRGWNGWWAVHGMSFLILLLVTNRMYASDCWRVVWICMAAMASVSALLSVMSRQLLHVFIKRNWKILAAGSIAGILAWAAGLTTGTLWSLLGQYTFQNVACLIRLLPYNAVIDPETATLGTDQFSVYIAPVCSGYQGIGLMAVFIGAYLIAKRDEYRFPAALLLLPISLVLVWVANSLRILALIAIGSMGFQDIALGGFHAKAGWLIFCALALGIVAVSQKIAPVSKKAALAQNGTWNPTAAYLLPFLAAIATSMIAGLFAKNDFDMAYPLRIMSAMVVLWAYRKMLVIGNEFSFCWTAVLIGVVVGVGWIGLDEITGSRVSAPMELSWAETAVPYMVVWMVFRVVGSSLIIPIIEELAFRGFLLRRFITSDFVSVSYQQFTWLSFIGSSVAFGMMHGSRWLAGILAGMVFAWVLRRRGKLFDAITAHASANILIAVYVLLSGNWSLWL